MPLSPLSHTTLNGKFFGTKHCASLILVHCHQHVQTTIPDTLRSSNKKTQTMSCVQLCQLLRHMPDDMCNDLLQLFNHMLFSGEVPAAWRKTLCKMLPKTSKPRTTTDFRPIASIRLLYNVFAYMILARIEDTLDTNQPEEQHGFRSNSRIEEHLLTFNVILDKTLEMDQTLWIISLDLSNAFDRANWESLWQAVGGHGVSQHLVWILQSLYYQQRGKIVGSMEDSFEFDIAAGVRQGCVLSPRLFRSLLECALSKWRAQCHGVGYGFQDGGVSLLDPRLADDILIFAKSYEEIGQVLDMLVDAVRQAGLVLNAEKIKILTTQSQHRANIQQKLYRLAGYLWRFWHKTVHTSGWAV